jgi:hypothetical protein
MITHETNSNSVVLLPHVAAVIHDCVEVTLASPDDFLKVKETLTRIGVASHKDHERPRLYQSCHILHKRGQYYLVHFKELFLLDGKAAQTHFDDTDRARRNTIANMLAEWGLVKLVDINKSNEPTCPISQITIIPYRDKILWELIAKYEIGKKRTGL